MDNTGNTAAAQQQQQQQQEEAKKLKEQQRQAALEQRQHLLKQILEPAAYERLSRISIVRPEKATQIEDSLIRMAQQRQLSGGKVDEQRLIKMLEQVGAQEQRPKVTIRRKVMDDDSDDDFGSGVGGGGGGGKGKGSDDDDDDDYDSDDY